MKESSKQQQQDTLGYSGKERLVEANACFYPKCEMIFVVIFQLCWMHNASVYIHILHLYPVSKQIQTTVNKLFMLLLVTLVLFAQVLNGKLTLSIYFMCTVHPTGGASVKVASGVKVATSKQAFSDLSVKKYSTIKG
uniref:Uncharacterized protein n=1 Tax=Glossina brevipalpis TaxID=37001 RepID=A0A1A9WHL0_9MUSC